MRLCIPLQNWHMITRERFPSVFHIAKLFVAAVDLNS